MEDRPGEHCSIAVIYSRAGEGMGNEGKDVRGEEESDLSKSPQVEVGRASVQ